jgi:hypothetical protein
MQHNLVFQAHFTLSQLMTKKKTSSNLYLCFNDWFRNAVQHLVHLHSLKYNCRYSNSFAYRYNYVLVHLISQNISIKDLNFNKTLAKI